MQHGTIFEIKIFETINLKDLKNLFIILYNGQWMKSSSESSTMVAKIFQIYSVQNTGKWIV